MTARWVRCDADRLAVEQGCRFSEQAARRVSEFFRRFLRHSKGQFAGSAFELLDWQWDDVIAPLFGWLRADGTRRFRQAGIWIPKKQGKSTLCSGISLYLLMADGEAGAEVYSAAADRAQASIVYEEARSMVLQSPALTSRLEVILSKKEIRYERTRSVYKALSADVPTKEGLNIHGLIFDELHAQQSRKLFDTLRYGTAARRQPLLITISTAGYDRESIGYEQYRYAKQVLDNQIVDIEFFPFVREAAPEDDWKDPAVWRKANPSIGITVPESDFKAKCREAQTSAASENTFRRYRLNQWTQQDVRWLSLEAWDKCGAVGISSPAELEGGRCFGGLDLATTTDLAAYVMYFPREYALLCRFFTTQEACRERERRNRARLDQWIAEGWIEVHPGRVIDFQRIYDRVIESRELFNLVDAALDRWNATHLATQLQGAGVEVVGFGQGYASMTGPCKHLESLILEGKIVHFNNPVLRWMVGNVAAETDSAGNVKPCKKRSTEKIDGVVAAIMAIGRSLVDEGDEKPATSVYESRGVVVL